MLAEISAGLSSLKAAYDITKGLNAANSQATINEVKIPLQQHILDAQIALAAANEAQTASSQREGELKQEIVRLKDWSAEKQRYELKRFQPGVLAYALKPSMAEGEPPHYLCKHCYDRNEKSSLQATPRLEMRYRVHICPSCRNEYAFGSEMPGSNPGSEGPPPTPPPPPPYDRFAELRDE